MRISRIFLYSVIAVVQAGCALSPAAIRCRQWQNEGLIYSTRESCEQCVRTMGSGNVEMIQGCAVGLDASRLLTAGTP